MKKQTNLLLIIITLIGFISVSFCWLLILGQSANSFTISNLLSIHILYPFLWLVDIMPFFLFFGIIKYRKEILKFNLDKINEEEEKEKSKEDLIKIESYSKDLIDGVFNKNLEISDKAPKQIRGFSNNIINLSKKLLKNSQEEELKHWILSGKEKISRLISLHTDIDELSYNTIVELIKYMKMVQGAFFIFDDDNEKLVLRASYAYNRKKHLKSEFNIGEGLIGQSAYEMDTIYRTEIPDDYFSISSGILGDKKPKALFISPLIAENKLQGVFEFASFEELSIKEIDFINEVSDIFSRAIYNLKINEKTESLLTESNKMTAILTENEEELRQNAEEMRATQEELRNSNTRLEDQIQEVENTQKRIHALLENASEVISIFDSECNITYESPSIDNVLGANNMNEKYVYGRIHSSNPDIIENAIKKLQKHPSEPQSYEIRLLKENNDAIWLKTTGRNFLNNLSIKGIVFNTIDITQHKIAEMEQRKRGEMQALSENSPDLIIRLNTEGAFYYVNPIIEKFTGISMYDFKNNTLSNININSILKVFLENLIKKVVEKKSKIIDEVAFEHNNTKIIMTINAIPEFDIDQITEEQKDEVESILVVAHDITERKKILEDLNHTHKKITESINYAERIQNSIIVNNTTIREIIPNSFIYFKAKDVVSGDFPWIYEKGDITYLAAVDCTGHGVPGALLSLIGHFSLVNIVDGDVENKLNAAEILDKLHFDVRKTLNQDSDNADARDGMDIAFCIINNKTNTVQFSGAHRPLYLIRDKELIQYKGDRKAIGGIPLKKKIEKNFTNIEINIHKKDKYFIFSDGLPDQLHHSTKRKYSPKRIREIISENHNSSMAKFSNIFEKDIKNWISTGKQIDDILLIGFEI